MKINDYQQFELNFDCDEVRELLLSYILDRGDLSLDERWTIERHLEGCDACQDEYKQTKFVNDALVANRNKLVRDEIFKNSKRRIEVEQPDDDEADFLQFQAKMHRVIARRKTAEKQKRWIRLSPVVKISAIAACLVVGIGLFFATNQFERPQSNSSLITSNPQHPVKIEFVSGSQVEILPAGQPIVALNKLKTLRINDNRQMVLNVGTELSIEPYNLGCVVRLDKGEIYTEVEHDGKPFIVETSHGRAVITGTTFNIKADDDKMDLAVVEGSIWFESEKGVVDVKGGNQSSIVSGATPTKPVAGNVAKISQWAKGHETNELIQANQSDSHFFEMLDWPVSFMPSYCDLENIDFDVWINEHRQWFEREFPWTKRMQKLLVQDGTQVDTIDLLIESGDLWRFAWPENSQQRILADDRKVIQKVANQYGIEALKRWLSAFDKNEGNVTINSIHASTFLINTRSLAWFAVNGCYVPAQEKQRVLDLLAEQAKYASDLLGVLNQLLRTDKNESTCSVAQYDEYIKKIKEDISAMIKIEEELIEVGIVSE